MRARCAGKRGRGSRRGWEAYLDNALSAFGPLETDNLEQQIHNHGTVDVVEHVGDGAVERLEKLDHLVRLLVEQRLVDLCEVAGLQGVEGRRPLQEAPEGPQQAAQDVSMRASQMDQLSDDRTSQAM